MFIEEKLENIKNYKVECYIYFCYVKIIIVNFFLKFCFNILFICVFVCACNL